MRKRRIISRIFDGATRKAASENGPRYSQQNDHDHLMMRQSSSKKARKRLEMDWGDVDVVLWVGVS
jgi:hypothetical protein